MHQNIEDVINTNNNDRIALNVIKDHRIFVLVPSIIRNDIQFVRKVRFLASEYQQDVIFLSLVKDLSTQYSAERKLATLAAITRDKRVQTKYQVIFADDWVEVLEQIVHPGDTIICHEEQLTSKHKSLSQELLAKLSVPMIIFSGYYIEEKTKYSTWWTHLFYWGAIITVTIFFTIFEFNVDAVIHGLTGRAVLITLLLVEFSLIWIILNTRRLER